jgi:hypothetical protein
VYENVGWITKDQWQALLVITNRRATNMYYSFETDSAPWIRICSQSVDINLQGCDSLRLEDEGYWGVWKTEEKGVSECSECSASLGIVNRASCVLWSGSEQLKWGAAKFVTIGDSRTQDKVANRIRFTNTTERNGDWGAHSQWPAHLHQQRFTAE